MKLGRFSFFCMLFLSGSCGRPVDSSSEVLVHGGAPLPGLKPIGSITELWDAGPNRLASQHLCSGVFIDRDRCLMLTASHCFMPYLNDAGQIVLPAGKRLIVDFSEEFTPQNRNASIKKIVHTLPRKDSRAARLWRQSAEISDARGQTLDAVLQVESSDVALVSLCDERNAIFDKPEIAILREPSATQDQWLIGSGVSQVLRVGAQLFPTVGSRHILKTDGFEKRPHGVIGVKVPQDKGPDGGDSGGFWGTMNANGTAFELNGIVLRSANREGKFTARGFDRDVDNWLNNALAAMRRAPESFSVYLPLRDLERVEFQGP